MESGRRRTCASGKKRGVESRRRRKMAEASTATERTREKSNGRTNCVGACAQEERCGIFRAAGQKPPINTSPEQVIGKQGRPVERAGHRWRGSAEAQMRTLDYVHGNTGSQGKEKALRCRASAGPLLALGGGDERGIIDTVQRSKRSEREFDSKRTGSAAHGSIVSQLDNSSSFEILLPTLEHHDRPSTHPLTRPFSNQILRRHPPRTDGSHPNPARLQPDLRTRHDLGPDQDRTVRGGFQPVRRIPAVDL